jgi:hypothetical protein
MMKHALIATVALGLLSGPAAAGPSRGGGHPPAEIGRDASIRFANYRGVRDFHPVGDDAVYLQDAQRRWYRAQLAAPCFDLPFANRIGIDTRGSSNLDRFGTLIVGRDRCQLISLVKSEAPPRKQRKAEGTKQRRSTL